MLKIRRLGKRDIEFVLVNTQREQWGHTRRDVERCLEYEPRGCFVAEWSNQKVGHVFTIGYDQAGWIGLLIVDPEHRGSGLGTQLMKRAIQYLQERGVQTIGLDAEPRAVPLYERLGFEKTYDSLRFKKQQTIEEKWQMTPAQNISRLKKTDLKTVARFDARIFGANRIRILRSLHEDFEDQCWVAKRHQKLLGYVMCRRNGNVYRVGPWVCRPKHIETAKALLETCIGTSEKSDIEVRIGVLSVNLDAVSLVESLRFIHCPKSVRMFMEKKRQIGDVIGIYGIAAPELG